MLPFAILTALAPHGGWLQYMRHQWFDTTFTIGASGRPLYVPNAFDLALLIPYFAVLSILAFYGFHRYALVFLYYKHRRRKAGAPTERFTELPRVTVQLPLYNERYVVERLVEAVCRIDYPRERLEIQVLDDSTDETVEVARAVVERCAARGEPVVLRHRDNRHGFKAGALQEGMAEAQGEFIAIFDADFVPPPDFLRRTIDYFTDPKLAMVQTRWGYINRDYSWLTKIESILLDGHFVL